MLLVRLTASLLLLSGCGGALCGCAGAPPSAIVPETEVRLAPSRRPASQAPMTPPPSNATAVREPAADPAVTDPELYKVVMENEHVRVLRYHDVPGTKTRQHQHPDSVLYALSSFRRRLTFADGTSKERDFSPGDVMWVPAQIHVGENVGVTNTEVLLVEVNAH